MYRRSMHKYDLMQQRRHEATVLKQESEMLKTTFKPEINSKSREYVRDLMPFFERVNNDLE